MKTLFALLLLHLQINFGFTQQVVVANTRQNIVYCGVDNPISALADGYSCQSIILTTDNGKITKTNCGQFNYKPARVGLVTIKIWIKQGQQLKKVGEVQYRCKRLGPPISLVGISSGGNIKADYIRSMGGVRSCIYVDGCCQPVTTVSYRVIIERDKNILCFFDNSGAQYSDELMKSLQKLKSGDTVFISHIICEGWPQSRDEAEPLKFTIVD